MNDTMRIFLDDGLSVYSKARATITFFEEEISRLLLAAVDGREKWPFLESHKIGRIAADKGGGQFGDWLMFNIDAVSHRKEQVVIECGIWWNAIDNGDPIIYLCLREPKSLLIDSRQMEVQGIKILNRWGNKHWYLPIKKSTEISDALNRVLDELLQQLK